MRTMKCVKLISINMIILSLSDVLISIIYISIIFQNLLLLTKAILVNLVSIEGSIYSEGKKPSTGKHFDQ